MAILIDELKSEHSKIVDVLNEVKGKDIRLKETQEKLLSAKAGLLAHLNKEDEKLYPVLKRAAEKDKNLQQTLDMFAKDMEDISSFALSFFDKYSQGGLGIEFAQDFGRLTATLSGRIRKEENVLFVAYEKLL